MLEAYTEYHDAARATMRAGASAHDVHRAVSAPFHERGYPLGHVTGHSIGMTMIEHPKIGEGVEVELREGMIFSMHPHAITDGASACMYMQDTWCIGADARRAALERAARRVRRERAATAASAGAAAERCRAVSRELAGEGLSEGHRTLADRAFGALHEAIVAGHLAPGERLPIEELGDRARDERDADPRGAAAPRRRRARREHPPPRRARDASSRSTTSPRSTRRASRSSRSRCVARPSASPASTPRSRPTRLATLNALADENSPETWAAHTAFHFSLYEAAGSAWLIRRDPAAVGDEPALPPRGERARASSPTRRAEHATILQACVDHDAELAAVSLHNHLTTTANVVARAMGGEPLFEPAPLASGRR